MERPRLSLAHPQEPARGTKVLGALALGLELCTLDAPPHGTLTTIAKPIPKPKPKPQSNLTLTLAISLILMGGAHQ